MKVAIVICATKSYQYALRAQARAILQNVTLAGLDTGHIVLVTDENDVAGILEHYRGILEGWEVHHLPLPVVEGSKKDYGKNAQLLIAQLYTAGFDHARSLGVDAVWTLEADVIPESNNLRCMVDMLRFDGGYYDVAFCPYVSAGGGGIMGGRGTANNWIFKNIYEDELELPQDLIDKMKAHKDAIANTPEWTAKMQDLEKEAKACPPKHKGNVFKLNGDRWRRRGWLDYAYPAIGKGAVLPSDWLPMGNNLFSKKATLLTDFMGYAGTGTQDLYLAFNRLAAQGLKFCVIPHSVSHHVVKKQNADNGPLTMYYLHHEQEGECVGHLRQREVPFYAHEAGEHVKVIEADFAI